MRHLQRSKEPLRNGIIPALACIFLNNLCRNNIHLIVVCILGAERVAWSYCPQEPVEVVPIIAKDRQVVQRIGLKACMVRHHLFNHNILLRPFVVESEIGKMLNNRVVPLKVLHLIHHICKKGACKGLGCGGYNKLCIGRVHTLCCSGAVRHLGISEAFKVNHFAILYHYNRHSGNLPIVECRGTIGIKLLWN